MWVETRPIFIPPIFFTRELNKYFEPFPISHPKPNRTKWDVVEFTEEGPPAAPMAMYTTANARPKSPQDAWLAMANYIYIVFELPFR